jgi:hypothetical protein
LREVCRTVDPILSPNCPGIVRPGAFDGFPTGGCVVAGLQGAAILRLNSRFQDGRDLILIETNIDDIMRKLTIIRDRRALAQIGRNGRGRLIELFGNDKQMSPIL